MALNAENARAQWMCDYVKALSGDTFIVNCEGNEDVVRVYGIDAPDTGQIWYESSKKYIDDIMKTKNTYVVMQNTQKNKKDRYGRIQAWVFKDGVCINEKMIESGMAFVYDDECKIDKCSKWKELERVAINRNIGLWFLGADEKPWEFRKNIRHLANKNRGYFEDILYVKEGDEMIAYETNRPEPKAVSVDVEIPPPPVEYVPVNGSVIYNINQTQVRQTQINQKQINIRR